MKPEDLSCWKCGTSLKDILLPFSRMSKCKSCQTDLHVCKMCEFYDTTVNNSCREPVAEKVTDKTRKNFCGYLQPSETAHQAKSTSHASDSKQQLDALFGLGSEEKSNPTGEPPEDEARRKLEELFGKDKK
ncbi:MAG: hypothetical protein HKN08_09870 [Gammaproteobacteria bacterium]|nr:hypothetical protein [Gammaproteobacteria bacterium]